ncbi:tripartite tricarboxylate transporter TctB family protein [Streptosporangium sp. NBC_01495]|uniref:tripartite tricarboxylate transporter TctB family protein n=1 Tax=Streptosporangium sp. NBC_01495 TaxID=2903899 RepID=UPI002E2FB5CE|nr:tripartite tricarboxylate transporter TctB family protein [Streptosporangium sp. NBC_01495]
MLPTEDPSGTGATGAGAAGIGSESTAVARAGDGGTGRDTGAPPGPAPVPGSGDDPDTRPGAAPEAGTGWSWRRPELGLAVLVLALGAFVIAGTADVTAAGSVLGLGPRFFPALVGGAMLLIGLFYVVDVLRGGHGDPEDAEDVDSSARADWRTVALVSVIFLAFAGLLDLLGWIIAGALLFFGLSVTLGAAHRLRAGVIAILLSTLTYLMFVKGLGVTLPAGLLSGVI